METVERSEAAVTQFSTGANLRSDEAQEFAAIDAMVRAYEKQWVLIAQQCIRVQSAELWRHGGYHSYEHWLNEAAPRSARTIFYHVGVVKDLAPDFTTEEMAEMRPESAKTLRKVSKAVRHDPAVRNAAKGSRRHLVSVLSETHPEELIEQTETMELHFEKSFIGLFQTFLSGIRVIEDSEELSYEAAIELAIIAWFNEPFGDSGLNNLQRLKQLEMLK
jgi:hypothetical protein